MQQEADFVYDFSARLSKDLCVSRGHCGIVGKLSVEDIAAAVNLSSSHFSYVFKRKTGFSPIDYFNHLKIQKACQYLLFTNLRIKEIGDKIGITDPYYFSHLFTKIMGHASKGV